MGYSTLLEVYCLSVSVGLIGKLQNLQDPSLSCQISPRGKVFSRSDPALDPY